MTLRPLLAALLTTTLILPATAQEAPVPAPAVAAAPATPRAAPKLLVVISVDQLSGDLFTQYRTRFTGGFRRLLDGAVFPMGYQGHAATETCPGHSTIMTGARPARTGIIANEWIDQDAARADKTIYCAEDERVPGSTSRAYTVADLHLKVPTLGERMKAADPRTRTVSVAGKDRAAVMMGGHRVDELWWWDGGKFVSYAGRAEPDAVRRTNAALAPRLAAAQPPLALTADCAAKARAVGIGGGKSVGDNRLGRAAGDARGFRAGPEFDGAVLALAAALVEDMQLGRGPATDVLTVGASGTDYVGHTYGTEGVEMCLQMGALDASLEGFFAVLDRTGVDYAVALTADHGGLDLPERARLEAVPEATRIQASLGGEAVGGEIQRALGLAANPLLGSGIGDMWIDRALPPAIRARVLQAAVARYRAHPQVEAVFTAAELAAARVPASPPDAWTIVERAAASFDPERSGDFYVALKPRITPIADPTRGYVATHGSVWDYDRRVPILFWRKGMTPFEQPMAVETVDIAPTLASLVGHRVAPGEMDGRCLDLDVSAGSNCR